MTAFTGATFVYDGATCSDIPLQGIYGADHQPFDKLRAGSVITYFVGGHYEVTGSQVTKYYFAGTTRIAMRKYTIPQNMSVEYFLGDHLGSTSITTDANGAKLSEMRYKAWGEVRYSWTSGQSTTPAYKLANYTYTGQYSYTADFGLMFYNARWYDPALGRFAQADTIVSGGVQGLDRYAYANNAPTRFTDPSGHRCVPEEECDGHGYGYSRNKKAAPKIVVFEDYTGSWSSFPDTMEAIENKAYLLGLKLASALNRIERDLAKTLTASGDLYEAHHYSAQEAFLKIFGKPVTFTLLVNQEDYAAEANYQGGITRLYRK